MDARGLERTPGAGRGSLRMRLRKMGSAAVCTLLAAVLLCSPDASHAQTGGQLAAAAPGPKAEKSADILYSQGVASENQGNVAEAVKLYDRAAKAGSAAAAKRLGDIYRTGKGGAGRDGQMSLRYYALAKQIEETASGKAKEPQAGADKAKLEREAAKVREEQEAAGARARAQQEAAVKAKAEQEAATARAQAQAQQEAATKAKADREAAVARAKAQDEAAAKARAEQQSDAAAKAQLQQEAATKAKAEREAAAKTPSSQVALAASGTQAAQSADALYSQGLELENQGNVAEAVKLYEKAVKAGSGPAAKKLGAIYRTGKGGIARDGQASMRYDALARQRGESVR